MQRTLVMIRHAKSSWSNPLQSDYERPLNERGKQDAPDMGKRLKEAGVIPDLIIASSAKRTRQTAKRIAHEVGYNPDDIQFEDKLYHCIPSIFEELIYEVKDKMKTIFIIAHNPGITDFVNQLSGSFQVDNMPTCGIVAARMELGEWNSFPLAQKDVFLFDYPKNEHDTK
ncbi:MAG: histidine phosphatase family protein [Bacteroidota bacterium]